MTQKLVKIQITQVFESDVKFQMILILQIKVKIDLNVLFDNPTEIMPSVAA